MKTSLNKYKRFRNNQTTSSEHKAIKLAISDKKKKKKKDWEGVNIFNALDVVRK